MTLNACGVININLLKMKLESLKTEKFRKLESNELGNINGGNNINLAQDTGTGVTVTWTKAEKKTDDVCSDC
ncbi:hypothetical protein FLJU110815_11055 [Flavobacterium jumunjinense]